MYVCEEKKKLYTCTYSRGLYLEGICGCPYFPVCLSLSVLYRPLGDNHENVCAFEAKLSNQKPFSTTGAFPWAAGWCICFPEASGYTCFTSPRSHFLEGSWSNRAWGRASHQEHSKQSFFYGFCFLTPLPPKEPVQSLVSTTLTVLPPVLLPQQNSAWNTNPKRGIRTPPNSQGMLGPGDKDPSRASTNLCTHKDMEKHP